MPPIQTQFPATFLASVTYYVDSVNGSDSNTGKSPSQALQTLNALPTLQEGESVGLARGSYWREQVTISADNVVVFAYGSGDTPVLDAADVLAESWTKTDGRTNVYQASVSLAAQNSQQWVNAFEDGVFLTRAASIAACDSTPGSYFPSANFGNITLYVYPKGSTNPTVDGKTYEVTARDYGVLLSGANCELHGVETRNNLSASGSLVASGRSCRLINCVARNGNKHNVFVSDGGYHENVSAIDCYYGANTSTLFVYNENTPAGLGIRYKNCTAQMTTFSALVSGFYGHINISGNFGALAFEGCDVANCQIGYSGIDVTDVTLTNCTAVSCGNAINPTTAIVWTINSGSFSAAGRAILLGAAGITLHATGATLTSTGLYTISGNQNNLTLSFTDCTIDHAAFGFAVLITTGTNLNIAFNGTTFARSLYLTLPADVTYTGDNNVFVGGASGNQFTVGSNNYTLAQWKALVAPHDANSVAA